MTHNEKDALLLDAYTNDTMIWVKDDKIEWKTAKITEKKILKEEVLLKCEISSEETTTLSYKLDEIKNHKELLPPLKNPDPLSLTQDLTLLNYLHEPGILNVIKNRYINKQIYTYSGIVLIAMNPFSKVDLYEKNYIELYEENKSEEPHLFAISQKAYSNMIKEKTNQTVIVSGESGAGKTVSAKYIMRYFASIKSPNEKKKSLQNKKEDILSETEKQILATNPILEAFGNAKTTRNDNSSRFGKYIEILFDSNVEIIGARIRTYLLERSRLICQAKNERNYHIFYQMCLGASQELKDKLKINNKIESFLYTNQGQSFKINNVDDGKEFEETCLSLTLIGIEKNAQEQIFSVLATILHLGNIAITGSEKSSSNIDDKEESLLLVCEILKISPTDLKKWITNKQIITRSEKIITKLTPNQANLTKDSVAKYLYANLFDWLIKQINLKLSNISTDLNHTFIGVLDIYGFEHFEKNSFEQLCINYANEKLQQQFTQHVFKLEQEEYIKEQINWDLISFNDNQLCIDIIEGKLGILSLLNEQSKLPSGSDYSFINKLYSSFNKKEYEQYFSKPKFSNSSFTICHYADSVDYESEGFLEKNSESANEEILQVLRSSEIEFVNELLQKEPPTPVSNQRQSKSKGQTLSSTFKTSLSSLMETINKTQVHYIRCIKPNKEKESFSFDTKMTLSQLRACGVLETIKISSRGYSSKKTFNEFSIRYKKLLKSTQWNEPDLKTCNLILGNISEDKYQIGKTKIFMKSEQLALFEAMLLNKNYNSAVTIQKLHRRNIAKKHFLRLKFVVAVVRKLAVVKAKKIFNQILLSVRARGLQAFVRSKIERTNFKRRQLAVLLVQAYSRGKLAININTREKVERFTQKCAAKKIQRFIRNRNKKVTSTSPNDKIEDKVIQKQKEPTQKPSKEQDYTKLTQKDLMALLLKKDVIVGDLEDQNKALKQTLKEKDEAINNLSDSLEELRLTMEEYDVRDSEEYQLLDKLNTSLKEENQMLKSGKPINKVTEVKNKQKSNRYSRQFTNVTNGLNTIYSKFSVNNKANPSQSYENNKRSSVVYEKALNSEANGNGVAAEEEEEEDYLVALENQLLVEEIVEELIVKLNIPILDYDQERTQKEILFPANLIGMCTIQMHSEELTAQLNLLIMEVCGSINNIIETGDEDFLLVYWLSNTLQLLSILTTASKDLEYDIEEYENDFDNDNVNSVVINSIKRINSLADKIKQKFLKQQATKLSKMAVQGLIEYQALEGYLSNDNNFFNRLVGQAQPVSVEQLVSYLTNLTKLMESYFLSSRVVQFILEFIIDHIGTEVFNNLIQRRGFLSWKRGTQMQYNISKLEEWINLQPLNIKEQNITKFIQVTKLLQMQKTNFKDLENIINACYLLNSIQIQKLLANYIVNEDDNEINIDLLKEVNRRASLSDKNETLFVSSLLKMEIDFVNVLSSSNVEANSFIPSNLKLKRLRLIASNYNN